ncbi:hypothetical protein CF326_g6629 [Tilletia indica]|nr:hypothetical protein CF326_g6629 [Tilletia indica]
MASPPTPGTSSKTVKWTTHLALTGDVILGTADTKTRCITSTPQWTTRKDKCTKSQSTAGSREVPLQVLYLIYRVPFATNPNRLGVAYPAQMRRVPDEFEGEFPKTRIILNPIIRAAAKGPLVSNRNAFSSCGSASFADYAKRMRGSDLDRLLSQIRYRARLYLPQQDPPMATVQGADHVRGQHPLGAAS